jgi:hypothetical protein
MTTPRRIARASIAPAALVGLMVVAPLAMSIDTASGLPSRPQPATRSDDGSGGLAQLAGRAARRFTTASASFIIQPVPHPAGAPRPAASGPAPVAGAGALLVHLSPRHVDLPPPSL